MSYMYMFRKGMNKMSSTYKCIKDEKWVRFTFNRAYIYATMSLHPLKYILYFPDYIQYKDTTNSSG